MLNRIERLKDQIYHTKRTVSLEQALIITNIYKKHTNMSRNLLRAMSFRECCRKISIKIDDDELIVGNRTKDIRQGVVFPEASLGWIIKEMETLSTREQDAFELCEEQKSILLNDLWPYWKDKTLEHAIYSDNEELFGQIDAVVKINQRDHAQGHICPDVSMWLSYGINGLLRYVNDQKLKNNQKKDFYHGIEICLEGAQIFMLRYAQLAEEQSHQITDSARKEELKLIAYNCSFLAHHPPQTFFQALQSIWFLFVLLHLESNASSFSLGRMDQYLYPFFKKDIDSGIIDAEYAGLLLQSLYIKFNHIIYMRNKHSAKYFAGFPIGFNIVLSGKNDAQKDMTNELTYLMLDALEIVGLPQPNLSVRLHKHSPLNLLNRCVQVLSKGYGMPQFFNDEGIIESLIQKGISKDDAYDYAVVGCVELSTQGNMLGWSDAAMVNLVKILELTLNHGRCLITGKNLCEDLGGLDTYKTYQELEYAFEQNIDYFISCMFPACENVERRHMELLPTPFLSSVVNECCIKGMDVTEGGAKYNLSGIQLIQIANVADSLAAIKKFIFEDALYTGHEMLEALRNNYEGYENIASFVMNHTPHYGNDLDYVDMIARKWVLYTDGLLKKKKNLRGGIYHSGLYTVSAHVPMGNNVGATPDGRKSKEPLADGGLSAVYGRDIMGPTALLKSVSKIPIEAGTNGTLLNMKFSKSFFSSDKALCAFSYLLQGFVRLKIKHVQFNVLNTEDLLKAQKHPEHYRHLIVRVAGYTAYFVDLDRKLQNEIIARTMYDGV